MSDFEIVGRKQKVDHLYGYREYTITIEDILALLQGKALYGQFNVEYAFKIMLEKEKKDERPD